MPGLAVMLELTRRECPKRLVTPATGDMRRTTQFPDRDLLIHRHMKKPMKRAPLARALDLRDPLLNVTSYHVLFSFLFFFLKLGEEYEVGPT